MAITNIIYQALQQKSQDILNTMHLFSSKKISIQKLREEGWNRLLENVLSFSKKHDLNVLSFCEKHDLYDQGLSSQFGKWRRQLSCPDP